MFIDEIYKSMIIFKTKYIYNNATLTYRQLRKSLIRLSELVVVGQWWALE